MPSDWDPLLRAEASKPYWHTLQTFVAQEREAHTVYPPPAEVLASLQLTPCASARVMILGQDPYHGAGQAHGLSFSVGHGTAIPPSLANIFKELATDIGVATPSHGSLESWATQGVLLLNTTLTVRAAEPASHQGKGWETFTDEIIRAVNNKGEHVVFVLWGNAARKKSVLIDTSRHTIIESAHPSPLSAHRGFFCSKPFSRINTALAAAGQPTIEWQLTEP